MKKLIITTTLFLMCSVAISQTYKNGVTDYPMYIGSYGAMEVTLGNKFYYNELKGRKASDPASIRMEFIWGHESESGFIFEGSGYYDSGDMGLSAAAGFSSNTGRKLHGQALIGADFNSAFLKARIVFSRIGINASYHSNKQFYVGAVIKLPTK